MTNRIVTALLLLLFTTGPAFAKKKMPLVDLNRATVAQLVRLPGIGPSRAAAILEQRKKRPFKSVQDLRAVRGIGPKRLKRISHLVKVAKKPNLPTRKKQKSSSKKPPSAGGRKSAP